MNISKKLNLSSLVNTRDLGGIKTIDGHTIKKNMIFRSGKLFECSEEDIETLYTKHHLRTVIDFRTDHENGQAPDVYHEGIKRISNPILTEAQMGITKEEKQEVRKKSDLVFVRRILKTEGRYGLKFMQGLYINFIHDEFCRKQYANFIRLLISEEDSILYHCSVGKDRVGTGTLIFLSLLGVNQKDILQDFVLTNEFIEPSIQKNLKELSKDIKDPRLEETYRDLFSVRVNYGEGVIKYIDENYGSFDNYRKSALGITDEEVAQLKAKYLD